MRIDWWTLALQTVNVLVLIWLLGRYLFTPVAQIIEARGAAAAKLLSDAERARGDAEAMRLKAREEESRTAAARADLLRRAASDAEAAKAVALEEARREAEAIIAARKSEYDRLRVRERLDDADEASRLAVDISAKVLTRLPPVALIAPFIDGLATTVSQLPPSTRSAIAASSPLRVKTPRSLTADEDHAIRQALAQALGGAVDIAPEVDSGVIAGVELEAVPAAVRNSLRADLERIAKDLTAHDDARR